MREGGRGNVHALYKYKTMYRGMQRSLRSVGDKSESQGPVADKGEG